MTSLTSFPFLNPEEFRIACRSFVNKARTCGTLDAHGWTGVRFEGENDDANLIVQKTVDCEESIFPTAPKADAGGTEQKHGVSEAEPGNEIEPDNDEETLIRPLHAQPKLRVEYSIMLSPTYQVPVLYFLVQNNCFNSSEGLDAIYRCLIPPQYRSMLKEPGVMGGLSMGYHPKSGLPVYFVHPCNTPEAMRSVAGEKTPTAESYLLLWLGLVGNCVNLHIPSELVVETMK